MWLTLMKTAEMELVIHGAIALVTDVSVFKLKKASYTFLRNNTWRRQIKDDFFYRTFAMISI